MARLTFQMDKKMPADNGRFCEMAAVAPQTILCGFERLSPAGTLVEAATSQSRWDVGRKRWTACRVISVNFDSAQLDSTAKK